MVKMAVSQKQKMLKSALKISPSVGLEAATKPAQSTDMTMVASQNSAISQLTEQVLQIKLEHKQMLNCFDWLAAQLKAFMTGNTILITSCKLEATGVNLASKPDNVGQLVS